MGLKLRERRRIIFILIATCIPLIILTCHAVQASPDSRPAGPDIEVPGGYKISDQGGMDVGTQQSSNAPLEGLVQMDETISLAGTATGAGLAAAHRMMAQRQREEEEKRKKVPKGSGSSAQGSSSAKGSGSSAIGFVGGRPFARGEPQKAMPTSFDAQPTNKGASDDKAFPWHEVPGAYLSSMASIPSGILEGLKENYSAWKAYFEDPTSVAPSNIAPYLMQYGSGSMGFPVKAINPDAGAVVMTAVDFIGLGKIPFTGNLPRGLILESLKHGGGLEDLQEGFKYTSLGQVGTLASIALDPSKDEHLRAQCAGQLMAQGSLIAFSMLGPKLIPKVKSGLVEALEEIKAGAESTDGLHYVDVEEFMWRQAINQAVQDGNLEALVQIGEDLGELRNYCQNGELSLALRGKTDKATEGHNIRVQLPPSLIETIMAEEGPIQVELIDSATGETYSFYRDFHNVEQPYINIPFKIMQNFQADQEVIVKIRNLPVWEFANSVEGDAFGIIKFNNDGVLVAKLGGKEIPIQSLDYDYWGGLGMGGSAYVEFQVEDITGKATKFRVYDNGLDESHLIVYAEDSFRSVESLRYDPRRDIVDVEYRRPNRYSRTTLRFGEPPEEIDLDAGMATEEMRRRVALALESGNKKELGNVGEEIASKFAKEKLKAKVFPKVGDTGPDREIILDGYPGILEAKLTTYKSQLETQFVEALYDVCKRFDENGGYRQGIAITVYFDKDNGFFDLIYRIVTPETQDMAFKGLHLTNTQIDIELLDRPPAIQSFAGYPINQDTSSNARYTRQQTMFGPGQGSGANSMGRQKESKIVGSSAGAQDTSNNKSSVNTKDAVGVGSKQYNIVHSQSKDQQQISSSQSSVAPAQREQQGKKTDDILRGTSDTKNKSPTNSQYKDREWTSSSSQSSSTSSNSERQESRTKDDSAKAQSTSSNMSTAKAQDKGVESKQWSLTHSQSKQQGPSNQHTEPPKQGEQGQKGDGGSKATSGNKSTTNSQCKGRESSKSSNQSSEPPTNVKQQEQEGKINDEYKTTSSSKSTENPDTRRYASSPRGGPKLI